MQFRLVHTGRVGGGVGSTNMYHKLYSPDHVMNKIFQSSTTKKKKKLLTLIHANAEVSCGKRSLTRAMLDL